MWILANKISCQNSLGLLGGWAGDWCPYLYQNFLGLHGGWAGDWWPYVFEFPGSAWGMGWGHVTLPVRIPWVCMGDGLETGGLTSVRIPCVCIGDGLGTGGLTSVIVPRVCMRDGLGTGDLTLSVLWYVLVCVLHTELGSWYILTTPSSHPTTSDSPGYLKQTNTTIVQP